MFLGHLPAGYLLTRGILSLSRRSQRAATQLTRRQRRRLLALGLLASVAPDLDLLWFYTLGRMQRVHHDYWPHLPVTWLGVLALGLALATIRRRADGLLPAVVIAGNGLLHLVLDTIAGGIQWLWPFEDAAFRLIHVQADHGWWVWNFLLHPSLSLEFAVLLWATLALRADGGSG